MYVITHQSSHLLALLCLRDDAHWLHTGPEGLDLVAVGDEELGEVPLNVPAAGGVLEFLVQGMSVIAVDVDLGEKGELGVVLGLNEILNLGLSSWLLGTELVARESENHQVGSGVLLGELS